MVHQLEGFSWDYEAPNVEFYLNSIQTDDFYYHKEDSKICLDSLSYSYSETTKSGIPPHS